MQLAQVFQIGFNLISCKPAFGDPKEKSVLQDRCKS